MAVLSGVGSLAQAGTGLIGTVIGAAQSHQNLNFQKQQFAYQQELNRQYLDRMDRRLQYMTADAKKAGINPLAAIGHSGGYSPQQSAQAPQLNTGYLDKLDSVGNAVNQYLINSKLTADTKVAMSQANQLTAQTLNTTTDTDLKKQMKANLKHDLDVANKLNAPVGVLPDVKRDLYHEIRDVIDKYRKGSEKEYKSGEHFLNNSEIDAAIEKAIDNALGDSFFNKGRKWLGKKIEQFNYWMNSYKR